VVDTLNNKNAKIISQVGQYIYGHSDQVISLDRLASYIGFSKYHFNHIFFAATGYQLGEFIQRHKLEKALYLIKQGNHNIIDVALSVGYDSSSSFSRAFKKNFSVTPSDLVQGNLLTNDRAGSLKPRKRLTDQKLEPVWKTLPDQKVYGFYGKGFNEQSFSAVAR
jgi:AraC family transcriptional regulator